MPIRIFIASLVLFSTIFHIGVDAQPTDNVFQLFGSVNIKHGKVILLPFADGSFYPGNMKVMEQRVQRGHFHFSGKIEYPYAFYIQVINDSDKLVYVSNMFFIDSGIQKIRCKVGNMGRNPDIENVTTTERNGKYNEANREIKNKITNLYKRKANLYHQYHKKVPTTTLASFSIEFNTLTRRKDTILWDYVKQYPNSYMALWELVRRSHLGYEAIYDSIYAEFSTDLRHTVTGMGLHKKLQSSSIVNTGNKFPKLILRDVNNIKKAVSIRNDKKYTLIDFWFSDCFPCISQFSKLKELYQRFNKNTLDIISISVDDSTHINNWKKVIVEFQIPWKQYLDLNGKESKPLGIFSFPTNFLLDREGNILESNIDLATLQLLLEE